MKKVKGLLVILFILIGVTGCFQSEDGLDGLQNSNKDGVAPGVQSVGNWYFRGTANDWGTTEMTQDGDLYSVRVEFGEGDAGGGPRFKIDNGEWTENYPLEDYIVEANKTYDITFDSVNKSVNAVEYNNNSTSDWYFRGTANNWEKGVMEKDGDLYSIRVEFGEGDAGGGPRFKIDNGEWTENYPLEDYIVEANKTYDITFDSVNKSVNAVEYNNNSTSDWYFRGTANNWEKGVMEKDGDLYSIRVEFGEGDAGGGPRFKIDNGEWTENYPLEDYIVDSNSTYDITFDAISKEVSAIKDVNEVPSTPVNVNVSVNSANSLKLTWDNVSLAENYGVYMAESYDGNYVKQLNLMDTYVTIGNLTENSTYYFKINALNSNGISSFSNIVSSTPKGSDFPSDADDGVMLHAYRWTFSGIEGALDEIYNAGYKSIQVSPVQGTKTDDPNTEWYMMYQPVNLHVGNAQLGSYEDFKSLCDAAEGYGIDIIVDAVLNQVADNGVDGQWDSHLDPALQNWDYFHNNGTCDDYSDRESVTQENLGNGPDWATQRSDVQQLHLNFLNEAIGAGADGFRFDAAKHIETDQGEDAWKPWAGGYWNTILNGMNNKEDLYIFGEVLPDGGDNDEVYTQYFDITAHKYGNALRWGVTNGDVTQLSAIWHHDHEISPTRSLVYVENHDDYEHGASSGVTYWGRKMANAIIVARDNVTPRIFDRPNDDIWNDVDLIKVNKFHNAMVGKTEYIRTPEQDVIMIERGDAGSTIVNVGGPTYINSPTNLKNGTYNSKTGNATLNVSGGYISGNIPGGEIVVLY